MSPTPPCPYRMPPCLPMSHVPPCLRAPVCACPRVPASLRASVSCACVAPCPCPRVPESPSRSPRVSGGRVPCRRVLSESAFVIPVFISPSAGQLAHNAALSWCHPLFLDPSLVCRRPHRSGGGAPNCTAMQEWGLPLFPLAARHAPHPPRALVAWVGAVAANPVVLRGWVQPLRTQSGMIDHSPNTTAFNPVPILPCNNRLRLAARRLLPVCAVSRLISPQMRVNSISSARLHVRTMVRTCR